VPGVEGGQVQHSHYLPPLRLQDTEAGYQTTPRSNAEPDLRCDTGDARDLLVGRRLEQPSWVVERAFPHLHWFRRLRIRWEIRDDIHEAFLTLGCALICWRRLNSFR
jgi:hypothetical protein